MFAGSEGHVKDRLPEVAYYYSETFWTISEVDTLKPLLLFFDRLAILLPRYMRGRPAAVDPVLSGPLEERGLLTILEPETFVDQIATESLADAMVTLITSGAFDELDKPAYYAELSRSRMGWNADVELSDMLVEELKARDLARDSEDGVSIPLHPVVRTTVLVILSMLARSAGRRHGLDLHPVTAQYGRAQDVIDTLKLSKMPSAGHVVSLDLTTVGLDLSSVPLDEILAFRQEHGEGYRAYARNLRDFIVQLGSLPPSERERALHDRREELLDKSYRLQRLAMRNWRKPLAGFSLGIAGAAWTAATGDVPAALLGLGAAIVGVLPEQQEGAIGAYSYLCQAGRSLIT